MNLFFNFNKSWSGALGDLGPVATTTIKFFGPILTFLLAGAFLAILISNVIPLMKKDTPPAEKQNAKKSLLWWLGGIGIILIASLVITIIFFGFGKQVDNIAPSVKPTTGSNLSMHLMANPYILTFNNNLADSIFKI